MEVLFAIGNGRMSLRSTSDFPVPAAQPDLLIAGVYDQKAASRSLSDLNLPLKTGRQGVETEIVPFPSPLSWIFELDQVRYGPDSPGVLDRKRTLDLRKGLSRQIHRFEDGEGRKTRVKTACFASMLEMNLLVQQIELFSENHWAPIELRFPLRIEGFEGLYPHLTVVDQSRDANGVELLVYRTRASEVQVAFGQKVFVDGKAMQSERVQMEMKPGEKIQVTRWVSVCTSRDLPNPSAQARISLERRGSAEFESSLQGHSGRWNAFWEKADLEFESAPALTQAQRFNLYHLKIAADHDPRVSIPAKALTGRAYEGHVFWDTEIFMFPFYLFTEPEIARFLLEYRFRTLDGARARAKEMGYEGACYAWESTLSGKDMTPTSIGVEDSGLKVPVHTGAQQLHVTADVAYAIWRYWDATLDHRFLSEHGAEILIETARFWASRVSERRHPHGRSFHIHDIVGPDEYHHGVQDNAFTNWMARFNLEKAAYVIDWLRLHDPGRFAELSGKLDLNGEESGYWRELAARIFFPVPNAQGVLEQFRGFFGLKRIVIPKHERSRPPISRLLHWKEVNSLQLVKQADVLMLPFLFPEAFSSEAIQANYHFYEPITDHGSSLSPCVHGAIAARAGLKAAALQYWENSLHLDLFNSMDNTELGVHAATLGGTWQALVFHLLGVRFGEGGISYAAGPEVVLPRKCPEVKLKLTYRGRIYPVQVGRSRRVAA